MNSQLAKLEPAPVWRLFDAICAIPHPSGHETRLAAALAALASQGLCEREVTAVLPGGALEVRWADDGHIYMSGPAVTVFEGEYEHGTDEREFPEAARQLPLL